MWTATLDLNPRRVLLTRLLARFWHGAYFSSFAPLRVENMPRQQLPGSQWVRVRNRLAGICGSDLHLISVDGDLRVAPAALPAHTHSYLGHEVVGEVIEVGDDVQTLRIGDRVALQHGMNCVAARIDLPCPLCASGNYTLCERGVLPEPHPIGGGWSEEMLLHEQQLFRIPQDMSDEQAVLLEPTAVAVHAVLRRVPQANERVLIAGAGTIGLLTLQVVRALAPQAEISVLARYPFQIEKATRMGAAHIIYPQDSYREVQRVTQAQLYEGAFGNRMLLGGYDVIYDTIGNRKSISNALRWTRAKGTIVLVGLNLHLMNIDLSPIWYQEIDLLGAMGQGIETWPLGTQHHQSTFDITADLIMQGQLHPEQLITHHFALSNYRAALQTAMDKKQGRSIKVVFDYSMQPASVVPNVRASARVKRPTTTTLIPQPADDTREPETAPVQAAQPTPSPDVVPAPIAPVHTVPSIQPIAQSPATPDDVLAETALSGQEDIHEYSTSKEPSVPSSYDELSSADLQEMNAPTVRFNITSLSSAAQEPQEPQESQEPLNEYHEYTPSDDYKNAEQNGHHQQATLDTQSLDQGYGEQEESFYSFYSEENREAAQASVPFAESDVVSDIPAESSLLQIEDQTTFFEDAGLTVSERAEVPESTDIVSETLDETESTATIAATESAETSSQQDASLPVDTRFIAPIMEEKTTTRTDKDRGHNRTKRRKKTHYLVLPQHSQSTTDTTNKESSD